MRTWSGVVCAALILLSTGCATSKSAGKYPLTAPANAASFNGAYRMIQVANSPKDAYNALLVAMNLQGLDIDVSTGTMASGAASDQLITAAGYIDPLPSGGARVTLLAKHSGVLGAGLARDNATRFVGRLQSAFVDSLGSRK